MTLGGDQVAYDAVTHRPLALRSIDRGGQFKRRTFSFYALTRLPDLPAHGVSFAVPKGGAGPNPPSALTVVTGKGLGAARAALGTTPLWLGQSFRGQRLRSVVVGRDGQVAKGLTGRMLLPARFARFDYGSFTVKEFGQDRPSWYLHDPPAGKMVLSGSSVALASDGVLVTVAPTGPKFHVTRATALALAEALRPAG